MNTNHKPKSFDKPLDKSDNSILTVFLSIIAVVVGIQLGNLLYKLDLHIIDGIDTENFRSVINLSMPIVESVYNSGKASVSFSGEIKELFTRIFDFDLDSPATILNAQSPVFMSYYRMESLKKMDMIDMSMLRQTINEPGIGNSGMLHGNGDTVDISNGDAGAQNGSAVTGNNSDGVNVPNEKNGGSGSGPGNGSSGSGTGSGDNQLAGILDGGPESSMSIGTEYGVNQMTGMSPTTNGSGYNNQGGQQQAGNTGSNMQIAQGDQLISSITYEIEDEEEGKEKDSVELDKIKVNNYTNYKIDIAKLLKEPLNIDFSKKGPKVLVYHTHTSESYVLKEADLGKKGVASFNSNPKYSVVRVGEELTRHLEKYGIDTLHNGTVHDKVRDAAYGVSINTLQSYKKSYPSLQVYIDVHRDAVENDKPKLRITKEINGKNCAQIMFVVGAEGMLPHPQWQENLKFVLKLQQKLNEKYPGLARPVRIVGKRYNQQIANNAILIEVGGDGNLLSECIESSKYLAEVLNDVMKEK